MQPDIQFDPEHKRFFTIIDGHEAVLDFVDVDDQTVDFTHTFVPPELRGQGIAAKLVAAGLAHARAQNKKIIASCSYVHTYLQNHPK